jgi:hypothetical protein
MGSTGLNNINIEGYMNVFEIMVDDLVAENGGLDCSLAIEHNKRNQEELSEVVEIDSPTDLPNLKKSNSISSISSGSLHP